MAFITRYFGVSGAGLADGTSYANRAPLFNAGNWSTIITGFNFATDHLICMIDAGTYTGSQALSVALFTVSAPDAVTKGQLWFAGCDSTGAVLTPPDPTWNCAGRFFSTSTFPLWNLTASWTNALYVSAKCLSINFNGSGFLFSGYIGNWDWVYYQTNNSNAGGGGFNFGSGSTFSNSIIYITGTAWNYLLGSGNSSNVNFSNIRIEGNPAAATGTRYGLFASNTVVGNQRGPICVVGCPGGGFVNPIANVSHLTMGDSLTIVNCNPGFGAPAGLAGTSLVMLSNSFVVNCPVGVTQVDGRYRITNCRLGNTSNFNTTALWPVDTYEAAYNAADFVDAANGDYRIARTSPYWGRKLGAGDQPYHVPNLRAGFQS